MLVLVVLSTRGTMAAASSTGETMAGMQSMVPQVTFTSRQRVFFQLVFSFTAVVVAAAMVKSVRGILDAIEPEVKTPVKALSIWTTPVIILLCLVPAVFVFFLFKYHFDFMEPKQEAACP